MKIVLAAVICVLIAAGCSSGLLSREASSPAACRGQVLDVTGNKIWVDRQGVGATTVVFEAGFGNDSTVWTDFSKIEQKVRALGFQTLIYDRAGMGKSLMNEAEKYSLANDARILSSVLDQCAIQGPIVIVAHSYGGAIALATAVDTGDVKGLVLLDAVIPGVWDHGELEHTLSLMLPELPKIKEEDPVLAKVAVPFFESLQSIYAEIKGKRLDRRIPIVDIVAGDGQNGEKSAQVWRTAHRNFVAEDPKNRTLYSGKRRTARGARAVGQHPDPPPPNRLTPSCCTRPDP